MLAHILLRCRVTGAVDRRYAVYWINQVLWYLRFLKLSSFPRFCTNRWNVSQTCLLARILKKVGQFLLISIIDEGHPRGLRIQVLFFLLIPDRRRGLLLGAQHHRRVAALIRAVPVVESLLQRMIQSHLFAIIYELGVIVFGLWRVARIV